MSAEMVGSAVAQEAVNQVLSRLKDRCEQKSEAKNRVERMEMAHIRLEASLETSKKWNITTSSPLLRWQSKLKRAAQECDHTLRRCRQRLQEEEELQNSVRTSFPNRIAYAARSFVSSIFSHDGEDELTGSAAVRRFERFADGASEFLRYVELGGTPHRYMFFDSLIHHLLSGKGTKYCFVRGSQHLSFLLQPFRTYDHGVHGLLVFLLKDSNASENNFLLSLTLRLSESIDIVRIAVSCLQLFMPHLSSTIDNVKTTLTQLPTQDLCWASSVCERQNDLYSTTCSNLFQPNPLCCQERDHYNAQNYNDTSSSSESLLCDIYLEPVTQVYLFGHISLSVGKNKQRAVGKNKHRAVIDGESETSRTRECPYLKLGMHFWPHSSFEDLSPRVEGSATEVINGEVQHRSLYANISCFEQLCNMMVPKAVDCLHGDVVANSYQMLWRSKHGGAYLHVERKDMGRKHSERRQVKKLQGWTSANNEFMNSWIAHAPAKLLGLAMDWFQKEKRLPRQFLFITNSCIHDCPMKLFCLQYLRSVASKIKSFSKFNA